MKKRVPKYKIRTIEFTPDFIASLPKQIDPITNCWLYTGYIEQEYAVIKSKTKPYRIHRISVAVYQNKDYFDYSWLALHKIICPNKHCFNPEHLYPGSGRDNVLDMVKLGTHGEQKAKFCSRCGGEYSTRRIKSGTRKGSIWRWCRACVNKARRKKG